MVPEREMPAADCYSANFVSATLLPPPNQNDSSLAAAAASVRFPSVSGQGVSDLYSAAEKSGTAGSSSLSTAFQAEQTSLDLYVPQCEDEAELEWLSRFMEESTFCDVPDIAPPRSYTAERTDIGRGARSKRPRSTAWASLALSSPSSSSSSSNEFSSDGSGRRKKGSGGGEAPRRCTHCESEKTPQWRTGPLGPKTLCNACGVRYKSGRLVPEYRPAASPTFVLTQHSSSHRRVMELRRQKELFLLRRPQHSDPDASSAAQPEILFDGGGVC